MENDDKILKIGPLTKMKDIFSDLPPLKQIQKGVNAKDVSCKEDSVLILKSQNNSPACVSPNSAKKLESRGWGFVP